LEGFYIFKVFKDLQLIFVIQNFASFFQSKRNWQRDFNFFNREIFTQSASLIFISSQAPNIKAQVDISLPQTPGEI